MRPALQGATLETAWFFGRSLCAGRRLGFPLSDNTRIDFVLNRELEDADFRSRGRDARCVRNVADGLLEPTDNRNGILLCHAVSPNQIGHEGTHRLFSGLLVDTPDVIHHVSPAIAAQTALAIAAGAVIRECLIAGVTPEAGGFVTAIARHNLGS
ncbi:MAG TPA: hypothetical protein VGO01_02520 [Bradyrhizobium sp.]|nr:hypothetical protein [Bradyrhizobium sp.]